MTPLGGLPDPGGGAHPPDVTIDDFLAAFRDGDFDRAGALFSDDARVSILSVDTPGELRGWVAFLEHYARRRQRLNITSWHAVQRSSGDRHVAVVTRLREADRTWHALSVYQVDEGLITGLWLHEPF